ncbi:MAG: hydrogenase maturation protease [Pirellulales bacterium]
MQPESHEDGSSKDFRTDVIVAGFGSPHGDDQAGWQVVALLGRRPDLPARLVTITEGTQLVDEIERCDGLIIVDACRGGAQIGTVTRLEWPDPRVRQYHNHSTHGIGLCNALELAERLGRMPPNVDVFGIEIGSCRPLDEISAEVVQAVAELVEIISAELCETVHA